MDNEKIFVYGVGKCYRDYKERIRAKYKPNYVCDVVLDCEEKEFDNMYIVKTEDVFRMQNIVVIICNYSENVVHEIKDNFVYKNVEFIVPGIEFKHEVTSEELKRLSPIGVYEDVFGNKIYFDESIPDNIRIFLRGYNSKIIFGSNIQVMYDLRIYMGSQGICNIGDETTFVRTYIYSSYGTVKIGRDCMFSYDVYVRNHDGHHIFDKVTGDRINYSSDINIADHVWVSGLSTILKGVTLLRGTIIASNSVVTKSFKENCIVGGNPARIIKENVRWKRDVTDIFNFDANPYIDKEKK